jgi:serine/threonine protein kinase
MSFEVGTTLAGKYEIERVLGQGGMGTVLLATHKLLDRSVAIKILRADAFEHPLATERLLREGRALARLRSKHIARVLDVEAPAQGPCFLVLEYLEGEDLGALLGRSGPLPISVAIRYVLEACAALSEAHAQGIVHRDIKPSNLFLTTLDDGSSGIKVIDFGISKQAAQSSAITQSKAIIGSPFYMAPEQMRVGGSADARSDIWSLGVVLFELLTAKLPYVGDTVLEICASILESDPPSVLSHRRGVPIVLDEAVRRCLARDPAGRYGSVHELAQAIAPSAGFSAEYVRFVLASDTGSQPSTAASTPRPSSVGPEHTQLETALPISESRKPSRFVWLLALPLVALVAGLLQRALPQSKTDNPSPSLSASTLATTRVLSSNASSVGTSTPIGLRVLPSAGSNAPPVAGATPRAAALKSSDRATASESSDRVATPSQAAAKRRSLPIVPTPAPALTSSVPAVSKHEDNPPDPVLEFGHY